MSRVEEFIGYAILSITITILLAFIIWSLVMMGAAHEDLQAARARDLEFRIRCLEAGYPELRIVNEVYYCIGQRDGNSVTIRAEDLLE